jgi:Nif-specific regulatory protein
MPAAKPGPDATIASRDARRLSTLLEVSQALSGTLNLKSSMQRVLQILIRHHGVVRGMVTLLREGELHVEAIEGFDDRARKVSFKVGEGITGQVAQSGKPIVVPRVSKEPEFLNRMPRRADVPRHELSFICVPIVQRRRWEPWRSTSSSRPSAITKAA